MSDKPTQEHAVCYDCESEYKITFKESMTSGFPRFCPFCGNVVENGEDEDDVSEEESTLYDE